MLVTFMPTAIFAEDEGENISLLLNNGKLVAEKISNPTHGEREADGLVDGGDRMNNYAWSMTRLKDEYGDYVYIGSNRNLIYSAVYQAVSQLAQSGALASGTDLAENLSMDTLGTIVNALTDGDVYTDCTPDEFTYAVIVRYNVNTGKLETVFDSEDYAIENPFYNDEELLAIGNEFVAAAALAQNETEQGEAYVGMIADIVSLYEDRGVAKTERLTDAAITANKIKTMLGALQSQQGTGAGAGAGLPDTLLYVKALPVDPNFSNIVGFRAAATFNGKAIFNVTYSNADGTTRSGFFAFDGNTAKKPTVINSGIDTDFSLRAMTVSKDGKTLYVAGASRDMMAGQESVFDINLFQTKDGETFDKKAVKKIATLPSSVRSIGGDVWDIVEYKGDLFVTVMTTAGAVVYRGHYNEGWTFELFAGSKEVNGEDGKYPIGFGVPEYYALTPIEFNGDLYFLTFANAYNPVMTASMGLITAITGKNISALFESLEEMERSFDKQTAVYRLTTINNEEVLEMVVGDKKDLATDTNIIYVAEKGSGFNNKDFGTTLYNWRAAEYNDWLYIGTFDSYQLLKLTTVLTNGDILQLDAEEFAEELDYIFELLQSIAGVDDKTFDGIKGYIVALQQNLRLTEKLSTATINWFLGHVKEIRLTAGLASKAASLASKISLNFVMRPVYGALSVALDNFYDRLGEIDVEGLETYVRVSKTLAANDNPGFELYRTQDGIHYETVALNGFNDKFNYGVRTLLPIEDACSDSGLLLGTANPFYGAQLWKITEADAVYEHHYVDGKCTVCGHECPHEDHGTDCVCKECGKTVKHAFTNGVCTVCGYVCTHSWSNGKCTVCGVTCNHPSHNTSGKCTVCGKTGIAHTYSNGKCTVCGAAEPKPQPQIIIWGGGDSTPAKPTPKKYNINLPKGVTADVQTAALDDVVTLTLDALYRIPVIKDANGKVISYARNGKIVAFAMPDSEVTITVMCSRDANCPLTVYNDVDLSRWYHDGIQYCLENNIMQGLTDTSFGVNSPATRGQFITMIWRIAGAPRVTGVDLKFKDIKTTAFYMDALRWAIKNNIITGITEDTFGPYVEVTREQIATMLYRYANLKGEKYKGNVNSVLPFVDANKVGKFSNEAVHWAIAEGLLKGKTATELDPKGIATRAEAAGLTQRFCER